MSDSTIVGNIDNLINSVGVNLFEDEIDGVIFQTNEFLTNATFQGQQGPFWWILQLCMCLGALFSIIMAAGMAYKMMVKGEIFDVFKILRVLGIAMIMCWWYPPAVTGIGGSNINWSILDGLSYVPNAVGSYTKVLYDLESTQVQGKFDEMLGYAQKRDSLVFAAKGAVDAATKGNTADAKTAVSDSQGSKAVTQEEEKLSIFGVKTTFAGAMILLDKIIMFASLVLFRVGWWATIYCQQILLGMLTIFGPIQWAFSILPKWEGAWAKWLVRYITVHFYGAMLYFVGFYVLLLFDIVLSIQIEELAAIVNGGIQNYLHTAFMTTAYLLVAAIVSLKCLSLVPDLAAWMIPEGEVSFSARSFGDGVASGLKQSATMLLR